MEGKVNLGLLTGQVEAAVIDDANDVAEVEALRRMSSLAGGMRTGVVLGLAGDLPPPGTVHGLMFQQNGLQRQDAHGGFEQGDFRFSGFGVGSSGVLPAPRGWYGQQVVAPMVSLGGRSEFVFPQASLPVDTSIYGGPSQGRVGVGFDVPLMSFRHGSEFAFQQGVLPRGPYNRGSQYPSLSPVV